MAATPASNALPPRVRTSKAEAVVSGCPADTPALRPITGGRSAALSKPAAPSATKTKWTMAMPPMTLPHGRGSVLDTKPRALASESSCPASKNPLLPLQRPECPDVGHCEGYQVLVFIARPKRKAPVLRADAATIGIIGRLHQAVLEQPLPDVVEGAEAVIPAAPALVSIRA